MKTRKIKITMETKGSMNKNLLTPQEVSEYLRIPLNSIYYLTSKGELNGVKIGKHWRYLTSEIEALLFGSQKQRNETYTERRKISRINTNIKTSLGFDLEGVFVNKSKILNLSAEGALLEIKKPIPKTMSLKKDDPINLRFSLSFSEDRQKEYSLSGRIVRLEENGFYRSGVKFRHLLKEQKDALINYIG